MRKITLGAGLAERIRRQCVQCIPGMTEQVFGRLYPGVQKDAFIVWKYIPVCGCSDASVQLEGGRRLTGKTVAGYLDHAAGVCVVLSTAGTPGGEDLLETWFDHEIRSAAVEAQFRWFRQWAVSQPFLRKIDRARLQAGFGDFSVTEQAQLMALLNGEKYGVRVLVSGMICPEKSALAIYRINK